LAKSLYNSSAQIAVLLKAEVRNSCIWPANL
jgi:hypothetical protein